MKITVKTRLEAIEIAKSMLDGSGLHEDPERTERAGYPIYTTSNAAEWVSDLGCRLEVNKGAESVNIWIDADRDEKKPGPERDFLDRLLEEYNSMSELVALCYAKRRDGETVDEGTIQWNRGHLYAIEDHLQTLAALLGTRLDFTCGKHDFGTKDWKWHRELEYITVRKIG